MAVIVIYNSIYQLHIKTPFRCCNISSAMKLNPIVLLLLMQNAAEGIVQIQPFYLAAKHV